MIYGDPGTVFALGISAGDQPGPFTLSIPDGLPLVRTVTTPTLKTFAAHWDFHAADGSVDSIGNAFPAPVGLQVVKYAGGTTTIAGGLLSLSRETFLASKPLGVQFNDNPDAVGSPRRMRLSFRGLVPIIAAPPLVDMFTWAQGRLTLGAHWDSGKLYCTVQRDGQEQNFVSTGARTAGKEQLLEVEWIDQVGKPGGTLTFFIDGKPAGSFLCPFKPKITTDVALQVNASLGNTRNSADIKVRQIAVSFDTLSPVLSYRPIAPGPISRADLEALAVDARAVSTQQPARTLSYAAQGGPVVTLDVTIGALVVPPGQAYKAVLVDWSSGQGVPHPNPLVMTKVAAQNCQFEDALLRDRQAPWIECLPRGPVPNIAGIDYRCEAIRCGDYVQFQFGYDWDAATMPANPFGDPTGKHSYMVPHKWLIYDAGDALLATVEAPGGRPLNDAATPVIFQGRYDGRNCAIVTPQDRWYPHGTVRSGVIWRSSDPPAHAVADVRATVPLFDLSVPFASHTNFSVNGFDLRLFFGGAGNDGQANGFGNCRVMSWEPTDYPTIMAQDGKTRDPYRASLYSANSLAPNAGLWLRYTPFNIQGRSPITGPGGTRDERQIIAEPVACYASGPTTARPHDGRPWRDIALHYLTGYVSDPVHAFERGRNVPLFKGNPRRPIVMRNHYYGPGQASMPESQGWFVEGGRISAWVGGLNPLKTVVPYSGDTPDTPYFGTTQIDKAHGHQFPGWGSLLFRTPEFAFLGHRFWDQNRLYSNEIIASWGLWAVRDGAWAFMHAALAWKTASANSMRLYGRTEILDFVVADFEQFHDRFHATNPGFAHPPANIFTDGKVDEAKAVYAAAEVFGIAMGADGERLMQADFQIGYWLSALGAAEKLGFNHALRAASPKARIVIDWLISAHRKRVVGRINGAPNILPGDWIPYLTPLWTRAMIYAAGGEVARMPKDYAELQAAFGHSDNWDSFNLDTGPMSRDGQALDQLMAGPATLRYLLRQSGPDLDQAMATVAGWRRQKIAEELKRGEDAGSEWFKYLQATNNPPTASQS